MNENTIPEQDFIEIFEKNGPHETARILGITVRNVFKRRTNIEKHRGVSIRGPRNRTARILKYSHRLELSILNGNVLIGSDAHYWPGDASTAHRAFVYFCKKIKPSCVIMNGDVLDATSISRFLPIGWEKRPPLVGEIETAKARLAEIKKASPLASRKIWTLGNHDSRFETRLASVAPEYANIHGIHLKDHFPDWEPCWSVWINDEVVIKHRFRGGIHATHNNVLWSGKTTITGHLHSLHVRPFTDYNGTRFGVDGGCIAATDHTAFVGYTEDNPKNWRSGFIVLTFNEGRLLWPEVVHVLDEKHVEFRGDIYDV